MNFEELYRQFRADKVLEVKPSTRALHAMHWKMLEPKIGKKDISGFGRPEARLLLAELLESGLSPKTAKDRMAFIKTISEILGHSKVSLTLDLYVHPTAETKRKTVNKAFRKLKTLTKPNLQ